MQPVAFVCVPDNAGAVRERWTFPLLRTERQFSRFVIACLSLGFLVLIASAGIAGWTVVRAEDHAQWVEHTYEVEQRVSSLRVLVERLEVARRGYLLSHRAASKQTFLDTVATQPRLIAEVRALTTDNPVQQTNISRMERLAAEQFRLESASMVLADRDRAAAIAAFDSDSTLGLTRKLREITDAMRMEENRLLVGRIAAQRDTVRNLLTILTAFAVVAIVVAIFAIMVLRRYTSSLIAARDAERTLAAELEDRVRARTYELSRANDEIQRFAYIVSHDLRSPLVNVMGFTGELEAAARPLAALVDRVEAEAPHLIDPDAAIAAREDLPESIGFIRTSTQKMDRLINAILRLSREGKRVMMPEPIDLAGLIETIVATLQHRLDELGATVTIERPMPPLVADRLAVEQMLSNLIENASKYLQPGRPGRIVVSARANRDRVMIDVADNGRGIDPRDHDRIFDLFRRSGQQDQPGEGIGLAHVRALAYRLGGLIDCRSALGEGATFTLALPARPVASQG
jgi:signal transduction histidine kinase